MKKSIAIQIPKPCHEDWQKMTSTEKGRFCSVCTKEVIDFTSKTDEELVKLLYNSQNLCGRFKKSQLNREVKLERKSNINLAPYAASLLVPLSLLSNSEANSSTPKNFDKPFSSIGIGSLNNLNRALVTTTGTITNENGIPVKGVKIASAETSKTAFSDKKGNYSITTLDGELLVFSKKDFQTHELRTGIFEVTRNVTLFSEIPIHIIVGKIASVEPVIEEEIQGDIVEEEICENTSEEKNSAAINITGTVSDDSGLKLPGVNVIIKGTDIAAETDFDGNYSIETEANQILTFRYIGFETQEITVSNISNKIDIQLEEDAMILGGEVIIVGGVSSFDFDFPEPRQTEEERNAERDAQKAAYKNEVEFNRIKRERKKVERLLKKSQKRK
jgi:hypothetical protein